MNRLGEPAALASADPAEPDPLGADAELFKNALEHGHPPPGFVVTVGIVAIAGMAAADQDAVASAKQGAEDVQRVQPAAAHQPNDPQIRRILHS